MLPCAAERDFILVDLGTKAMYGLAVCIVTVRRNIFEEVSKL